MLVGVEVLREGSDLPVLDVTRTTGTLSTRVRSDGRRRSHCVEMLVSRCGDVQETEDSPTNQACLYCPIATHGPCPTCSDDWSLGPSLPRWNSAPTNGDSLATHRYPNARFRLCHYCIIDDSRSFPRPTSFPIQLSRSLSSLSVANRVSPSFYLYPYLSGPCAGQFQYI